MKKVFSVLMVCAFAISATAQWLIYDYKVSIKRIDPQYTKLSYKIDEFDAKIPKGAGCPNYWTGYFDSFTTANDTLTGYVLMPACKPCGGSWRQFGSAYFMPSWSDLYNDSFQVGKWVLEDAEEDEEGNLPVVEDAYIYIQRKADKLYSNPMKPVFGTKSGSINGKLTWKLPVNVDAARFGKGAGARIPALAFSKDDQSICAGVYCTCKEWFEDSYSLIISRYAGLPTHTKPVKEAWMVLTYDVPAYIGTASNPFVVLEDSSIIYPPVKGMAIDLCCTPTGLTYGLIGYQTKQGSISHAGFGKVTTTGTKGSTSVGFCGSVSVDPTSCTAVNTISGTIAGLFNVIGFCSEQPQWDICYYFAADSFDGTTSSNKDVAPVCGNWSVKLNQSESKKYGSSFATAEARILDKLKCYPFDTFKTELKANFIYFDSVDDYLY